MDSSQDDLGDRYRFTWNIPWSSWAAHRELTEKITLDQDVFQLVIRRSYQENFSVEFVSESSLYRESVYSVTVSIAGNYDVQSCPHRLVFDEGHVSRRVTFPIPFVNVDDMFRDERLRIIISMQEITPRSTPEDKTHILSESYTESDYPDEESIPYVGLMNQGATCYMNSILQMLFHLPIFRKLIYDMDEKSSKPDEMNIPMNIQNLFAQLQTSKTAVSTEQLTHSFGWTDTQVIVQHDAQEFCRQLLDNISEKLKGTDKENMIRYIFGGKTQVEVKGVSEGFVVKRQEEFYDLSLDINDCSSLTDSFDLYVATEFLEGANRYESQEYGLQDAELTTRFLSLPRVLVLHLKRFEYDRLSQSNEKLNYLFRFADKLSLKEYLSSDASPDTPSDYELFGVLVHSGTPASGHYYSFLRTSKSPQWYKFNDSVVTKARPDEAITANWGGELDMDGVGSYPKNYSAYVLLYVLQDKVDEVYQPVPDSLIPKHILERIRFDQLAKNDTTLYLYSEADLRANSLKGRLFLDYDSPLAVSFMCKRDETLEDLYYKVRAVLNQEQISIWTTTMYGIVSRVKADPYSLIRSLGDYHRLYVSREVPYFGVSGLVMAFIYFYYFGSHCPLRFLETVFVSENSLLTAIADRAPCKHVIVHYAAIVDGVVELRDVSLHDWIRDLDCGNAAMFVLETDFNLCDECPYVADEVILPSSDTSVDYFDLVGFPIRVSEYFACLETVRDIELRCLAHGVRFLSVPLVNVQWYEFHNAVLKLYKSKENNAIFWKGNEVQSLNVPEDTLVGDVFSDFPKVATVVLVDIPDDLKITWIRLEIQIREDDHISTTIEEIFSGEQDMSSILSQVFTKYGTAFGESPLRLISLDDNGIRAIVSPDMSISELLNPFRLEVIPESQRDLPFSSLYSVSFCGFPNTLPVLIERVKDETFRALKDRIVSRFKMEAVMISLYAGPAKKWIRDEEIVPPEIDHIQVKKNQAETSRSLVIYN